MPAGTLFTDVVIESQGEDIKTDNLYIIDEYNMEERSNFQLMRKGGKYLLIPDNDKKKDAIASFKNYYHVNSTEALFFLYIPLIIIIAVLWILSDDISFKTYLIVATISFITRSCFSTLLGDFFLCLTVPSYIYLILRF